MTPEEIRGILETSLPECRALVTDTTGGGDHFDAEVVSSAFRGKTLLERHRLVYQVLGERIGREIHALVLRTMTPEESLRASGGGTP
jgi:stress-induced morphogen